MENQLPTLPPVWRGFLTGVFTGVLSYLIFNVINEDVDAVHVIGTVVGTAAASSFHLNELLRRQAKGEE